MAEISSSQTLAADTCHPCISEGRLQKCEEVKSPRYPRFSSKSNRRHRPEQPGPRLTYASLVVQLKSIESSVPLCLQIVDLWSPKKPCSIGRSSLPLPRSSSSHMRWHCGCRLIGWPFGVLVIWLVP